VLDFGVAKALGKLHTTREGQLKGKLGYLAPEQVLGHGVTRQSDVFAAGVVLWESLAGQRLFSADSEGTVLRRIMDSSVDPPSRHAAGVPAALDDVTLRALAKEPADRFETALAMAEALEAAAPVAPARAIGQWVRELATDRLAARAGLIATIESAAVSTPAPHRDPAPTVPDDAEHPHTSISVAADGERPPPPRRGSWAWVGVAGIAIGGGIVAASLLRREPAPPGAGVAATSAPLSSPSVAVEPVPPPSPAVSASTDAPPATASATLPSAAPARHGVRPTRPRPQTAPPQSSATTAPGLYGRE